MSNVLEAISKLKLKNSKKSLLYSSLILASLLLYRHMKLHCLKNNPCDYVFDDNLNSKHPIVIIFGTVIT